MMKKSMMILMMMMMINNKIYLLNLRNKNQLNLLKNLINSIRILSKIINKNLTSKTISHHTNKISIKINNIMEIINNKIMVENHIKISVVNLIKVVNPIRILVVNLIKVVNPIRISVVSLIKVVNLLIKEENHSIKVAKDIDYSSKYLNLNKLNDN